MRIIRNVLNRFWGGGADVTTESSDDEGEEAAGPAPRDDQDVD